MPHVIMGRVVLGEHGGVAVEGARAEAVFTGAGAQQRADALSASDGGFVIAFRFPNVETLTFRLLTPAGVLVDERAMSSPGDNQDTFDDLGELLIPYEFGGLDLTRRPPAVPSRPRVSGRVVDRGGECSIHCLQVVIEAASGDESAFRAIAVARTNRSGRFFADYPNLPLTAARAVIPGIEQPIPLPVTDTGLIGADPLLVIDLPEAEHAHEEKGCDCGSSEVPRLPGQAELADASATYSTDLGAGCVNFTTPNRAVEEFDFWTVVRTSQPSVRATSQAGDVNGSGSRTGVTDGNSIAWDDAPRLYEAATVAHGHLLHFRQTWYADGYSLGDLLYSLPLAPGQKRLISIVEWDRREQAGRQEATDFAESVTSNLQHNRDITEVLSSALSEQSRGGSTSSTWGIGAGTGGAGNGSYQGFNFGALFGISGGYSRADSEAWQNSARNFASTSMNSLRDRVLQAASAIRSIRSTVVSTVSESEAVRAETDVVANHNHCHALTIQYFEVLRHFQMRHEMVEVRECVFVPLPLAPFNAAKALRWRDHIDPYMLRPDLAGGIEALRRVTTNWDDVPTPQARYGDETAEEIRGEFEIEFQAYPPPLPDPDATGAAADALEQSAGSILASIFFPPAGILLSAAIANSASSAVSALKAQRTAELRYQKFHRDYMPKFADRFVNELSLRIQHADGTTTRQAADFTLVSRYQPDRTMLVSFSARVAVARADIQALTVESPNGIPDAVRCLVRAFRCDYATATFAHSLAVSARLNDDLDGPHLVPSGTFPAITFQLDPSTATPARIRTPMDSWERRNPREDDRRLAARLLEHLNANLEYYHHAIWWTMDPNRRYLLLDGFLAPNGGGRSLAQVVENKLIGIIGNSLVMPVAPGIRLDPMIRIAGPAGDSDAAPGDDPVADPTGLLAYYAPPTPVPPARVSMPTKGVFAEAVMGACNACERIDDSRFWRWEESPLDEPPAIEPASTASRETAPPDTTPTTYPAPIVTIQNAPAAPDPTDMSKVIDLLGRDAFRDITGLAGTQANAMATYRQNLETALAFGKEASELAKQAGMLAAKDRAFAAIDQAESDGKITEQEAHDLRMSALKKVVGDAGGTDSDIEAAKKKLTAVGDAAKSGAIDAGTASRLSGTILDGLAGTTQALDPERDAAARKIAEMPPASVSDVDIQRGDDHTRVQQGAVSGSIVQASTGTDWIFWTDLITFTVPADIVSALSARGLTVVSLPQAAGDLNVDYYPVRISQLPVVDGNRLTPEAFLKYLRLHLNDFVDRENSTFPPLDPAVDKPKWESDDPRGAVLNIQVNVGNPLGLPPGRWLTDQALVVCSDSDERHWTFSTLRGGPAAGHPVTGNRMWGIGPSGSDWIVYTMGADRATAAADWVASQAGALWSGADRLWLSFQNNVADFVNTHEGAATVRPRHSDRYPWDAIQFTLGTWRQI